MTMAETTSAATLLSLLPTAHRRPHTTHDTPPRPAFDELDPAEDADIRRHRALAYHEQHTPRRFHQATATHPDVAAWVRRYLTCPDACPGLLLLGHVGTGKTWQAYGALRSIADTGAPVTGWVAATEPDLYADLRPRGNDDTEARFARYADAPLLLLDDLGAARGTQWTVSEVLFRLVDHRYRHELPLIATSNGLLPELTAAVGQRTSSRLAQMCQVVAITGPDRRIP
jgi:DNA replication protein DnaC